MEAPWITAAVTFVTLAVNSIALAVSFTWKLSKVTSEIRDEISRDKEVIRAEIRAESRMVGETIGAVRTKITEVEIWSRDNFVRRDSFQSIIDRFTSEQQAWRDAMDERFSRFEAKLDRPIERRGWINEMED